MAGSRQVESAADATQFGRHLMERGSEMIRAVTLGRVVTFAATSSSKPFPTASVLPLIPRWRDDDSPVYDQQLDDVPVFFPGSRGLRIDWALYDGDFVAILFLDRPLDAVLTQIQGPQALDPQPADPLDPRTHSIADAVAVPVATFGQAGQVDLLDLLRDFMALVQTATTGLGDATLNPALQLQVAAMVARLDGVR